MRCQRKAYPAAIAVDLRKPCQKVVKTKRRNKSYYCSPRCREADRYYSNLGPMRAKAKARAADLRKKASQAVQVPGKRPRGRKTGEILKDTVARITIAAYMKLKKASRRAAAAEMYPLHNKESAWTNAKNGVYKHYEPNIDQEGTRLAGLPGMGIAEFQAAKDIVARP
jgi:hypothetical protein